MSAFRVRPQPVDATHALNLSAGIIRLACYRLLVLIVSGYHLSLMREKKGWRGMAIWNGQSHTEKVLEAADQWKINSFLGDRGVFDSSEVLWSLDNLKALSDAFIDNPDTGRASFIDKLTSQLSSSSEDVQQLATEALWLLYLFVSKRQIGPAAKIDRMEQIWPAGKQMPTSELLSEDCLAGIGKPGTAFMTKIPAELAFLISICLKFKSLDTNGREKLLSDPWEFGSWIDENFQDNRRAFRHMLLFLLFPVYYERISSWRHKQNIRKAFAEKLPSDQQISDDWGLLTTDKVLFSIRNLMEVQHETSELDFYNPPLSQTWIESSSNEQTEPEGNTLESLRFWIEKTIVAGRPDREEGPHSLGEALWSPQRSKNGGDIYANLRKINAGDVIFHLTDNKAIKGVSIAAQSVDDNFEGIQGTEWEGPAYRIQLSDYIELQPGLPREAFFESEPFASELREISKSGVKGLFFNSKLDLNQGAYLTAASPTLVSVLSRAYQAHADQNLPHTEKLVSVSQFNTSTPKVFSIDDALSDLFFDRSEAENILTLWAVKKNIILQGPPGVGKTFAAQRLAFALIGAEDRERIGFVQFHQSYSYEDFVEGYRPTESGFELTAGKFLDFCRRAEADPGNAYVFIIDEINRGNLSKILGELMVLIEGDKRNARWSMSLASSKVPFYVPSNVNLIGLMNTADRSLAVVDYALRRRFAFVDLVPKFMSPKFADHLKQSGVKKNLIDTIILRMESLNEEIISDLTDLGPGFALGHSYFCSGPSDSEDGPTWYKRVIKTEIAPLLREYWFDAPTKAKSWEDQLLAPL